VNKPQMPAGNRLGARIADSQSFTACSNQSPMKLGEVLSLDLSPRLSLSADWLLSPCAALSCA